MSARACYRVGRDHGLDAFELVLHLVDGRAIAAQLDDLSLGGLTAQSIALADVGLERGSALEIELCAEPLGLSVRVPARISHMRKHGGRARVGIEFTNREELQRELSPECFRFFNRRSAPRAVVLPSERIDVALMARDSARLIGRLHDLSVSGAAVWISGAQTRELSEGSTVSVGFQAEPGAERIELSGSVRWLQHSDGPLLCGIRFDPEVTAEYEQQRRELERCLSGRPVDPPQESLQLLEQLGNIDGRRVANRRVAPRARPEGDLPIRVELTGPGARMAIARLRDISVTGLGVVVPAREDPEFAAGEEMLISLRLDGRNVDLVARVRRGLLVDSDVCYGLELETSSEELAEHLSAIRDFVRSHLRASPVRTLLARL